MVKARKAVVYRGQWRDILIEIIDQGSTRSLYFDGTVLQSSLDRSAPHQLLLSYTRYLMTPLLFNPAPTNILLVGLGAGSLVHFLHHHFPATGIDVVDHAAPIIELARRYFLVPENRHITMHCLDGFDFICAPAEKKYDLVIIDAFDQRGMADSIYNHRYLTHLKKTLCEKALVSFNLWSGNQHKTNKIKQTIRNHFNCLLEFPVYNRGNVVALAGDGLTRPELLRLSSRVISAASNHFSIDFKPIINQGIKRNYSLSQRLGRLIH